MNRMTPILVIIGIVIGMVFAWALGAMFSSDAAPWAGAREMRGCWEAGPDRLEIRQGDPRRRVLEARFGEGEWRTLQTGLEGDAITAHFADEADLYEFRFEADAQADSLTAIPAVGERRVMARCGT